MKLFRQALFTPALFLIATSTEATPIINQSTGLIAPDVVIDFQDSVPAADVPDFYASKGVEFSADAMSIGPKSGVYAGMTGNVLYTGGRLQPSGGPFNPLNTLQIIFSNDVLAAVLRIVTNPGPTTFIALDEGIVVGSFTATTNYWSSGTRWWGFDIPSGFDALHIESRGQNGVAHIDDLSFIRGAAVSPSSVPAPGALGLLCIGLLGFGLQGVRRGQSSRTARHRRHSG